MSRFLLLIAVLLLATLTAHSDGGAMLLHQDAGPFTVTLFAAPQPIATGMAEMSVMVQDRTSGRTVHPDVELTIDTDHPLRLAANGLMQSGQVQLASPGKHQLKLLITRGGDVAQLTTSCVVQQGQSRAALVWFYILLPVAAIALFIWQQKLRRHP